MLSAHNLQAFYGDFQALFGIDFEIGVGETVAIIGANGAGKSTFLKTLCGLMCTPPHTVTFEGRPIGGAPAAEIVKQGIAMVPEGRRLFPSLSVEENLRIGAFARRSGPWTLDKIYALFPQLKDKRHAPAPSLSGGQQQMVAIGRALMSRPQLLLLDEPSLGLAPAVVLDMFQAIREINAGGTSVLLVEQNVAMAMELARRAYVMEEGRIVAEGEASALMDRPEIRKAYLGLETH